VLEMPDQSSLPGKRRAPASLPAADEGIEEPVRPESASEPKPNGTPAPKPEAVAEVEPAATPEAPATPAPATSEAPKSSNRRHNGAKVPARPATATRKAGEPRRRATLVAAGATSGSQATAEHESSPEAGQEATAGPEA
jgi:hypothetical protein